MQTDKVEAPFVENNDFVVRDGEVQGYVYSVMDEGPHIILDVVNDDGDHEELVYSSSDYVTIVTSFEEE